MKKISEKKICSYREYLISEEKSPATVEKYIRDIRLFAKWLSIRELSKAEVVSYKTYLCENYAPASVNAAVSSLNGFFEYCGFYDLKLKPLKIQRQIFANKEKELTRAEYGRLIGAAKKRKNQRLYLVMQTICSCGIRVSELEFITVEAVNTGVAPINCKGKIRRVYLPGDLCRVLKTYINERKIAKGCVFVTKNGKPLDRSNIWSDMKKLCKIAGVSQNKVFPHNLRHLFARTYYSVQKDVVRLADILGHSNVNTTRIYTMETGEVHRRQIQKLGLLLC